MDVVLGSPCHGTACVSDLARVQQGSRSQSPGWTWDPAFPIPGVSEAPQAEQGAWGKFWWSSVAGMQLDSCSAQLCQGMGMLARVAFPFLPAVIVTLHALFLVVSIGTMALGRAGKVWSH